jgi:hypothetical protein
MSSILIAIISVVLSPIVRRLDLTDGLLNVLIIDGCIFGHKYCISSIAFLSIDHGSSPVGITHRLKCLFQSLLHHIDALITCMHEGTLSLQLGGSHIEHAEGFGYILGPHTDCGIFLVAVCPNCDSALMEFALPALATTLLHGDLVTGDGRQRLNCRLIPVSSISVTRMVFANCLRVVV